MTKENSNTEPMLIGAAKLMEEVFESGLYRKMKTSENKLESIKGSLRNQLSDGELKRYELPNNLVAKFVPFPTYETDEEGLKEFLDDYGLLVATCTLKAKSIKDPDILTLLKDFQTPVERFAQFYLNKNGKAHLDKEEYIFSDNLKELSLNFLEQKSYFETYQNRYKEILKKIEKCPFLQQSKSIITTYGTCKLREKEIEFYPKDVYESLGSEFLIKHGQVSMKSIDEFIAKGFFSPKDIQQFRILKDINLRFVVMEKESEVKQSEFFHQQRMRKSQIRCFA